MAIYIHYNTGYVINNDTIIIMRKVLLQEDFTDFMGLERTTKVFL